MSNYVLPAFPGILNHSTGKFSLLRDTNEPQERAELKAHIKSGDYFSLLATKLDEVSQSLDDNDAVQSIMLQHLIENLLYLQQHYEIVKK